MVDVQPDNIVSQLSQQQHDELPLLHEAYVPEVNPYSLPTRLPPHPCPSSIATLFDVWNSFRNEIVPQQRVPSLDLHVPTNDRES